MVAKANTDSKSNSASKGSNETCDSTFILTERERQLLLKCIRLIQGNIPNKVIVLSA